MPHTQPRSGNGGWVNKGSQSQNHRDFLEDPGRSGWDESTFVEVA